MSTHAVQLAQYQLTYDFFDANPGTGCTELARALGRKTSTVRAWCTNLADQNILQRVVMATKPGGTEPHQFYAIPGKRLTKLPTARKKEPDDSAAQAEYAPVRPRAPARQIGMKPDPFSLPVQFFHPAAVSA